MWLWHMPMFRECHKAVEYEHVPISYAYVLGHVCVGGSWGGCFQCVHG